MSLRVQANFISRNTPIKTLCDSTNGILPSLQWTHYMLERAIKTFSDIVEYALHVLRGWII